MTITISLFDALLIVIAILGIVLLFQLIRLVSNLIPTAKSLSKVADDAAHITATARSGAGDAQKILSGFTSSLGGVSEILQGNKSSIAAITNLTNAFANIAALKNRKKK